jgi:hypothetical protein
MFDERREASCQQRFAFEFVTIRLEAKMRPSKAQEERSLVSSQERFERRKARCTELEG